MSRQQAESAQAERYERARDAIQEAKDRGISKDNLRALCFECGIPIKDLEQDGDSRTPDLFG